MQPSPTLSLGDYLSTEFEIRHEWINGEAQAISTGNPHHAAVIMNLGGALLQHLEGRPCRPTSSEQRVHIAETRAFLYPDVTVVSGPFEYAPNDRLSLVNPAAVFEVLSPSTTDHDLGAKFGHYRRLPSLQHFVAVDPLRHHLIHHRRHNDGWLVTDIYQGKLALSALSIELTLDEVYADLEALGPPS